MSEERTDEPAAGSLMKTAAFLACYAATIVWLHSLHAEAVACKSAGSVFYWVFTLPFFALGVKHLLSLDKPWPPFSGPVIKVYIVIVVMSMLMAGELSGQKMRKAAEGATRNDLERLRGDVLAAMANAKEYPQDIRPLLKSVPALRLPYAPHDSSSEIRVSTFTDPQDSGQWYYVGGSLNIDCSHQDSKGRAWSSF